GRGNVEVHQGDALRLDWSGLLGDSTSVKVVANIPYNITSPLLVRILEHRPCFRSATLLVQKEVAQRIVAPAGSDAYGSLSVFVAYHAAARIVASVAPGSFLPPPKVESAVVHLVPHAIAPVDEPADRLFRTTRAAFGQRRKTLRNALSAGLGIEGDLVSEVLQSVAVDPGLRAETLDLPTFARISRALGERCAATGAPD
ncbi:MAG: ribosomal RNA small subunit methyltransferase A, partial [Armatimonadota bacterium]